MVIPFTPPSIHFPTGNGSWLFNLHSLPPDSEWLTLLPTNLASNSPCSFLVLLHSAPLFVSPRTCFQAFTAGQSSPPNADDFTPFFSRSLKGSQPFPVPPNPHAIFASSRVAPPKMMVCQSKLMLALKLSLLFFFSTMPSLLLKVGTLLLHDCCRCPPLLHEASRGFFSDKNFLFGGFYFVLRGVPWLLD